MKNASLMSVLLCLLIAFEIISSGAATIPNQAVHRSVAITLDDLPTVSLRDDIETQRRITHSLINTIKTYRIPVIGFVNESKLYRDGTLDDARVGLLKLWLDAGLELGNHTFSHIDPNVTSLEEFEDNVIRGEQVTAALLQPRGKRLRYFRHPFLHTGSSVETKRKFEAFLAGRGYRVAPVTIDNSDWIFARAYDNAAQRGDRRMMKRIGDAYIPYMENKFVYFEHQSNELFGYAIKQILLIHANSINADYVPDLIKMMQRRGYEFISLDKALTDRAYASAETYVGRGGITWIHRWALTAGKRKEFFKGEPATPGFVMKEAGVTEE
jgi:peptidoglycan/xylan/chitin deacetylase (PgdA/CDA1 family)